MNLIFVMSISGNWYNPPVYLLFYELCVVCEKNCDEMVTKPLNDAQKVHYEDLIIEAARHQTDHEYISGNRSKHNKNGSGCIVYIYEGIYCKNYKSMQHPLFY